MGLFQQRPLPPDGEGGWGTVAELMTPTIAATKFYTKMQTVPDWQTLPLGVVAQTVQVSAFPDAYAQHEPLATAILAALTDGSLICQSTGPISAMGWVKPVAAATFVSGFRTSSRPSHDGVDIAAPKGTPIYAAAAGTVIRVVCNASLNGAAYICDVDGSPSALGCGWYAEILHQDGTVTRYCHMLQRPYVTAEQAVAAGQQIGVVGTSGNSSGPHLHLETHLGQPANSANAVDPVPFFASRGVDLMS